MFKEELNEKIETNHVRHIERCPIGMPYHDVVEKVWNMFQNPTIKRKGELIIDITGVGEPVYEMFEKRKLYPIGINIHGGNVVTDKGNGRWSVPRMDLFTTLRIMFESENIQIASSLPLNEELLEEIKNLRDRKSPLMKEEDILWRQREHDDIAFALMLCCWWAARTFPRIPEAYEHDKPWEEDEKFSNDYDPYGRQ